MCEVCHTIIALWRTVCFHGQDSVNLAASCSGFLNPDLSGTAPSRFVTASQRAVAYAHTFNQSKIGIRCMGYPGKLRQATLQFLSINQMSKYNFGPGSFRVGGLYPQQMWTVSGSPPGEF